MASETRELSKRLARERRRRKRLRAEVAEHREELQAEIHKTGRDLELRTAELRVAGPPLPKRSSRWGIDMGASLHSGSSNN
jgi:hypothetical protein